MFVDRVREIQAFKEILGRLRNPEVGEPTSKLLCFTGIMGVGKTYLLKHLEQLAQEQGAATAFCSVDQRDPLHLMESWCRDLAQSNVDLRKFRGRLRESRELGRGLSDHSDGIRQQLRQILVKRFDEEELRTLCFDLGVPYDDLRAQGAAAKAREMVGYLERRGRLAELTEVGRHRRPGIRWPDERIKVEDGALFSDRVLELISEFVTHLIRENQRRVIVFMLDDFEKVSRDVERWVWELAGNGALDRTLWVVATWGGVPREWSSDLAEAYKLRPFSSRELEWAGFDEEISDEDERELDESLTEFLLEANVPLRTLTMSKLGWIESETSGLPLMLNILSWKLRGQETMESPDEALDRRLRAWIIDSDHYEKVRKCAVARRLDGDILRALLSGGGGETEARRFWEWLRMTPLLDNSLPTDPEGLRRFNPIVRRSVLRTMWEDWRRDCRSLHGVLARHYDSLIKEKSSDYAPHVACLKHRAPLSWTYWCEYYYHTLSESPTDHLALGLEIVFEILDAGNQNVLRRLYDIARVLENVADEQTGVTEMLRGWHRAIEEVAEGRESATIFEDTGPLGSFLSSLYEEPSIQMETRIRAAVWLSGDASFQVDTRIEAASWLYQEPGIDIGIRVEAAVWLHEEESAPSNERTDAALWLACHFEETGDGRSGVLWRRRADRLG